MKKIILLSLSILALIPITIFSSQAITPKIDVLSFFERIQNKLANDKYKEFSKRIDTWKKKFKGTIDISNQSDLKELFSLSLEDSWNKYNEKYQFLDFATAYEQIYDIIFDITLFSPCLDSKTHAHLIKQVQETIGEKTFYKVEAII